MSSHVLALLYLLILALPTRAQGIEAGPLAASRVIKIRMLDSRNAKPINTSEIEVTMCPAPNAVGEPTIHPVYVRPSENSDGELSIPAHVTDIRVYSYYGAANWGYVNCDSIRDRTGKDHWYAVSQILATGVAAPNYCNKKRVTAQPGEFISWVRPMSFWEKMHE